MHSKCVDITLPQRPPETRFLVGPSRCGGWPCSASSKRPYWARDARTISSTLRPDASRSNLSGQPCRACDPSQPRGAGVVYPAPQGSMCTEPDFRTHRIRSLREISRSIARLITLRIRGMRNVSRTEAFFSLHSGLSAAASLRPARFSTDPTDVHALVRLTHAIKF